MNTKLNNWFIHSEYENKYGVFCHCINFDLYLAEVVLRTRKSEYLSGHFDDESSILCGDASRNNGNENGEYEYNFEFISTRQMENTRGLCVNIPEYVGRSGCHHLYYGGGSGSGRGSVNGLIV